MPANPTYGIGGYGSGKYGNQAIEFLGLGYYLSLLTSEYQGSPKLNALLNLVLGIWNDISMAQVQLDTAFDIDFAEGAQLDVLGIILGASRTVTFQPSGGVSPTLDDATYRIYLKAQAAKNQWDGTILSMQSIWQTLFPAGKITIADQQDMSAYIILTGTFTSILRDLILNGYIVPRPEGVLYNYTFPTFPVFAFDSPDVIGPIMDVYVGSAAGSGYTVGDVLTIVQAGASGGTAIVVSVDGGGGITSLGIETPGTNYSNAVDLATTGGTGTGALVDVATSYTAGFDAGRWT